MIARRSARGVGSLMLSDIGENPFAGLGKASRAADAPAFRRGAQAAFFARLLDDRDDFSADREPVLFEQFGSARARYEPNTVLRLGFPFRRTGPPRLCAPTGA